tara:strand:- start:3962 stop:4165 length:204 start_codon:yes stop_codon:yes gene_type:complete
MYDQARNEIESGSGPRFARRAAANFRACFKQGRAGRSMNRTINASPPSKDWFAAFTIASTCKAVRSA